MNGTTLRESLAIDDDDNNSGKEWRAKCSFGAEKESVEFPTLGRPPHMQCNR